MSAQNDGGPAFPLPFILDPTRGESGMYVDAADAGAPTGVSVRDWFAAKAMVMMASYIAGRDFPSLEGEHWTASKARAAYQMADAMLAAREVRS